MGDSHSAATHSLWGVILSEGGLAAAVEGPAFPAPGIHLPFGCACCHLGAPRGGQSVFSSQKRCRAHPPPMRSMISGTMGLSLNPVDIWKLFSDSKTKSKDQIAAWLDQAASEARQIADVWIGKYNTVVQEPEPPKGLWSGANAEGAFPGDSSTVPSYVDRSVYANSSNYERLDSSYESASTVFQGRDEQLQESFMNSAAQVLSRRNDVKGLYERLYGKGKPIAFLDDASREEQLDNFQSAVELLNREAAALEVLARNFRASK
jgi:hypothetical protein